MKSPLILASASPRRQELLKSAGVPVEVIPSKANENIRPGEKPEKYVIRLAREKAEEVAKRNPGRWVLGADTVVAAGGKVLEKPGNPQEAKRMLRILSGREHRVITGYCLLHSAAENRKEGFVTTRVRFKSLSPQEVRWYIATQEPFDKAGAYAIQGQGAFMIRKIFGSYTNVVGLPLGEVIDALKATGAVELFSSPGPQGAKRKKQSNKNH